eukprot:4134234-Pyramimonas_sp.AAC.1
MSSAPQCYTIPGRRKFASQLPACDTVSIRRPRTTQLQRVCNARQITACSTRQLLNGASFFHGLNFDAPSKT